MHALPIKRSEATLHRFKFKSTNITYRCTWVADATNDAALTTAICALQTAELRMWQPSAVHHRRDNAAERDTVAQVCAGN